nr:DUF4279 domain-containing protein [Gammaproteobacteria bacterium]
PTSISQRGERSVEKVLPRYSSWRLSTEPIIDERIDVDAMASTLIRKLEPKVQQINEVRRRLNVTTRLEVVTRVVSDDTQSTPAIGLSPRNLRFLADVGAYLDVDMYRN